MRSVILIQGKASRKKRQKELQVKSILKNTHLESGGTSAKKSLYRNPLFHIVLVTIVGFLVYSNTFHVPFHFDDTPNIVENYKLRDLNNFWPPTGSRWFGFLTFALNYHFGGLNTTGYHAVNLAIHIFNAILVYWLVVLTSKTPYFSASNPPSPPFSKEEMGGFALFPALLFVAHPIQTQAVTYIVQRFASLATMFYLLSLVMYIKFRSQQSAISGQQKLHATRYTLYAVSLISAILAMKTKEIAFTLPVVIALYEFMFFEGKIKKRLLYLIPLLFTMLIIPLSLVGIDKPFGDVIGELREAAQETGQISRGVYLLTQFRVIVTYVRLLFLPINQNLDHDYPRYHTFFDSEVFLSFLFLISIFGIGVYLLYRSRHTDTDNSHELRLVAFGIFWFFITLSVESSIIPIFDVIVEHRIYLPSVGAAIAISTAAFHVLHLITRRTMNYELRTRLTRAATPHASRFFIITAYSLLTTAIIVFSITAYQRNSVWQDDVALWEDVVRKSTEKPGGHINLGLAYESKRRADKAIEHYQIAVRLKPDYAEAYYNLGNAYNKEGWTDKAIEHYQIAIRLKPDYAEAYYNLGNAYNKEGRADKAIEHYQIAIRLKPDYAEAYNNLGFAYYYSKGWIDKAIENYQIAIRLDPDNAKTHLNLGIAYKAKGRLDKAMEHFSIARRLNPALFKTNTVYP